MSSGGIYPLNKHNILDSNVMVLQTEVKNLSDMNAYVLASLQELQAHYNEAM